MKRVFFIGLLFMLLALICQSQGVYSKQNLEKATPEDLNLYMRKAKKTKTAGTILTIVGPIAFVGGGALLMDSFHMGPEAEITAAEILIPVGFFSTVVGLPLLITGSSRVKKINRIKNAKFNGVTMEFAPCNFYNYQTQNHQPGLTLRVKF